MDLLLITGFLGAGKTTFLKELVQTYSSKKMFIIINEFGRQGIDASLVGQVGAQLAEINNGSIFCSCRLSEFEDALRDAIAQQPEIILVEASGLADPAGIKSLLSQPEFSPLHYLGGVCLVDGMAFPKVALTAKVSARQLSVSGLAIISKCDIATEEQLTRTVQAVQNINPAIRIEKTSMGKFNPQWLEGLNNNIPFEEICQKRDITLQKALVVLQDNAPLRRIKGFLTLTAPDTYRIKGFAATDQGLCLADCVGPVVQIAPYSGPAQNPGNLVFLAGEGMPLRKILQKGAERYQDVVKEIQWQ